MRSWLAFVAMAALALVPGVAAANPGVQVVECFEDPIGSGDWHYDFFVCTGDFNADEMTLTLTQDEIDEGTMIKDCSVPNLPGYDCSFDADSATWTFPPVSGFTCVPGAPDTYLDIVIWTDDESTIVIESFSLGGQPQGNFTTLVSCPPLPVEPSSWGAIKAIYRD